MKSEPPAEPPLLVAMGERKERLEAERLVLFGKWKAALVQADGNIHNAAFAFLDGDPRGDEAKKSYGAYLTKTFGLREWAAELRVKAGFTKKGRPWVQDRRKSKNKE